MRKSYFLILLLSFSFGLISAAHAQDDASPSLGDVARQARLARQQKDAQSGNPAGRDEKVASNSAGSNDSSAKSADATDTRDSPTSTIKDAESNNAPSNAGNSAGSSQNNAAKSVRPPKSEKRVLSNDDIAAHSTPSTAPSAPMTDTAPSPDPGNQEVKNPPEYWTTRILSQKNAIASLKNDIDQLSASIQYAPPNCVSGCVEWNENQKQKQQQVEGMKAQLQEQEKDLDDMQETARKQGYGSAVYDP